MRQSRVSSVASLQPDVSAPPTPRTHAGRIAVLYDFLQTRGGAERFTLDLRDLMPQADAWFHAASNCFSAQELNGVHLLSRRPLSQRRGIRVVRCIHAFLRARRHFRAYDTLLVSGHYAPLACDPRGGDAQRRVYYAHTTPLPFAYSQSGTDTDAATAAGVSMLSGWLRPRFEASLHGMHRVLANSTFTAAEYSRLLGVEATVLHPPCDIATYSWRPPEGYFLSFARQETQKRVDRIIAAFRQRPDSRLVIASNGSQHGRLVELAADAPNIRFVRSIDPVVIRDLLERCMAVVHVPEREPFGVSAVEALAAGKPVVSVNEGGLPEILASDGCGWLLPADPSPTQIAEQIARITAAECEARRRVCELRARMFDRARFAQRLVAAIAGQAP